MDLEGSKTIRALRDMVYRALLDPDVLKACVPGCTELSGSADEGFAATVVQKVGPVKATFKGEVEIADQAPPESLRISGAGKGGAAGFAKGGADVTLTDLGEDTELSYKVQAKVGGKLAQLGSRIIDGFAKKMADEFFTRFQEALSPEDEEDEAETQEDAAPKKGWFRKLVRG
ncbi:MAG: carbon monoxide dehydrogenase subunit G [Pseudomonadota bacterium]